MYIVFISVKNSFCFHPYNLNVLLFLFFLLSVMQRGGCFRKYSVILLRTDSVQDFDIQYLKLCERDSGEEREIVRMHFLTWPDHGVPDSSLKLLQVHLGKEILTVCKCVGDENCICIVKKNM